jgi:large subunit ribosomal protein L3
MKALLGRKIGMSQIFSDKGEMVAVTLIIAIPNVVTLRRTKDQDGYDAVQLALPKDARSRIQDTDKQLKKGGQKRVTGKPSEQARRFAARREFAGEFPDDVESLGVNQFAAGDVVEVSGVSKGKGFAGVVKRHGFKGGPASHGHRHVLRRPGSIGSRFPQHVFKGLRMAGRMGHDRVTVKNLSVVSIDTEKDILVIKGAVPGAPGSIVEIRDQNQ